MSAGLSPIRAAHASGDGLLALFFAAFCIGMIPIVLIGTTGWWMLALAMTTLITLVVVVTFVLGRFLGDD